MPNLFPCPNSQCNYQFDADLLPPAAMVTCPLCRTRFPYRAARPAAAPGDEAPPGPRVVNLRNQPKQGNIWVTIAWVAVFCLFLVGVMTAMYIWSRPRVPRPKTEYSEERLNFKLDVFPSSWEEDMRTREGLELNVFVRRRTNPDGWTGMLAEDFKDRNPRAGELRDRMLNRLKSYGRNMNFVELTDTKWMGQPAQGYQFQGDFNDIAVIGEVVAVSYKGIGYIHFAWSTDRDWGAVKEELLGMRSKIRIAGYREKWVEQKINTKTYTHQNPTYSVEDIDAAWQPAALVEEGMPVKKTDYNVDPKDIDPAASFAFRAKFQIKTGGDNRQLAAEAKAIVVEVPKGGDPLETAKQHLIERIKKEYTGDPPEIKLEPMAKSPANIALPADGPNMARLLFKDPLDKDRRHMYIISALNVEGKTIVVEADAQEQYAAYVEEWMVHLAASLKAGS